MFLPKLGKQSLQSACRSRLRADVWPCVHQSEGRQIKLHLVALTLRKEPGIERIFREEVF